MVKTINEFNTRGPGITVMLNPDVSKVKDVADTKVEYVPMGADILALRLWITRNGY